MTFRIPFNKPALLGPELIYVGQAVSGGHASGNGPFTNKVESFLQSQFDALRVLLTTSCTSALEMAAILCDLGPGDEVILPSFTFVSTANAIVLRGAKPIFVDIRSDTQNIDPARIEAAITPRTKAIFPVHYAGVACDMQVIMALAEKHDLLVVEDAAQGVYAQYNGRWLGTIGHLGCYSFHETKNFSCGEGGALVINCPKFIERAEIIREKGTNRSQFLRGQSDKYTWTDIGSSYVLSDMLAAFLQGQLENMEKITARRDALFHRYIRHLMPLEVQGRVRLPKIPQNCRSNHHMFYLLASDIEERTALIAHLKARGILSVFHYVPLHSTPFAAKIGVPEAHLPVTDDTSNRLLRLPLFWDLTDEQLDEVAEAVVEFFAGRQVHERA